MLQDNFISHVASNGAFLVHDMELALYGETSESVKDNLPDGKFGTWESIIDINQAITEAAKLGSTIGYAAGKSISEKGKSNHSILFTAFQHNKPLTIHPLFGADIYFTFPDFNGADFGKAAHSDFKVFVDSIHSLLTKGGIFINLASQIHGPMVFEKVLSMVRNNLNNSEKRVEEKEWKIYAIDLEITQHNEDPESINYYYRPAKTFSRCGVTVNYIGSNLKDFIPDLWKFLH
jgi:hypothetical protein